MITLLAALAICALAPSVASAATFTASTYPTPIFGSAPGWNENFNTEAGSVECAATYSATLAGASETVTVTPVYWGCQAFGFLEASVEMNGCDYVLHANGKIDLECASGKTVRIVALSCEVAVGTQTGLGTVFLTNFGFSISAQANVSGIAYTVTKDGFLCPFNGTGSKTGATYVQNSPVQLSSTNGATIAVDP